MRRHTKVPKDFEVQPLKPGENPEGKATCGYCGLSWDDDKVTGITPVPSARCPFEAFHRYLETARLAGRVVAEYSDAGAFYSYYFMVRPQWKAEEVARMLVVRSAWFEVTPLPDDEYRFRVKDDAIGVAAEVLNGVGLTLIFPERKAK
jgi:hypothetical protein